jgi:hypothetical protein
VAGIETGWDQQTQTPGTPWYMAFVRAMSAAKPYLYLMDADFQAFGEGAVAAYHDVCLLRGIWPGFFSANAFGNLYWSQPALYNRDRPVFKHYVPLLRRINKAGWRPTTHARLADSAVGELGGGGAGGAPPAPVTVERWGGMPAAGGDLMFTLRAELHPASRRSFGSRALALAAAGPGTKTLEVDAAALDIADGTHTCAVLSNGWGERGDGGSRVSLVVAAGKGQVQLQLRENATLLLSCAQLPCLARPRPQPEQQRGHMKTDDAAVKGWPASPICGGANCTSHSSAHGLSSGLARAFDGDQSFTWKLVYKTTAPVKEGTDQGMDADVVREAWASCNVHHAAVGAPPEQRL